MAVVVRVGQLEVVLVVELVGGAYVVGRVVCEEEPNTVTRFCFCSCRPHGYVIFHAGTMDILQDSLIFIFS